MSGPDMVTVGDVSRTVREISELMTDNRDLLVRLDQVNGDGDLGISMDAGFRALVAHFDAGAPDDLGEAFRDAAKVLNAAAPSSLGTILSFGLMGMARPLRGLTDAEPVAMAEALLAGVDAIMARAGSEPGEKTILDSLHPGATTLLAALTADADVAQAARSAARAAADGSESTRQMRAVHGRAAYSATRSIGILDGGSVVGRLIFDGIAKAADAGA